MRFVIHAIVVAILLVVVAACTTREPQEGDRELVLSIGQLEPYGLSLPEKYETFESLRREHWIDGSVAVEYEFDAPESLELPYLYAIAERHASAADACASYVAGNLGTSLGLGDSELSERNDLFEYGDKSRFGLLLIGGEPYGNYFGMCNDKNSLMIILSGFYFDDGELISELLTPTLDAVGAMD